MIDDTLREEFIEEVLKCLDRIGAASSDIEYVHSLNTLSMVAKQMTVQPSIPGSFRMSKERMTEISRKSLDQLTAGKSGELVEIT